MISVNLFGTVLDKDLRLATHSSPPFEIVGLHSRRKGATPQHELARKVGGQRHDPGPCNGRPARNSSAP